MSAKVDLIGHKYGRLTVIAEAGRKYSKVLWECVCDCGDTTYLTGNSLRRGNTKSCGCYRKEFNVTHGLRSHKLYNVHSKMMDRCYNPNAKDYKGYGGRGITVCDEWHDLSSFVSWGVSNGWEPKLQIDRVDNDKGYYPDNCRFVTRIVNMNNRRTLKNNKSGFTGICYHKLEKKYQASLYHKGQRYYLGYHKTPEEAAKARDLFIIEYNLPHKLQVLQR